MGVDRTGLSQNVGTEWDLQLVMNGQLLAEFGLLESRERKVNATLIETTPANNNGRTVRRTTYQGFSFTYALVRQNDEFDDLVDALVKAYHLQGKVLFAQGQETVINNAQASQWIYTGGIIHPSGLGNVKGADKTDGVAFDIHWTDRFKIRGGSSAPDLTSTAGL